MPKGKKTGGRDFKPGWEGGPGRPPTPPDLATARQLTRIEFETLSKKYMSLSKEQLKAIANDPKTPALDLMILSIISKGINQGDDKRLNFFLERFLGKVKENINLNVNTYSKLISKYEDDKDGTRQIEDDSEDQPGES